jgi:hypothetical protein
VDGERIKGYRVVFSAVPVVGYESSAHLNISKIA